MTIKLPLIGFDRYVDIEWCKSALEAAKTQNSIETVRDQVALMLPGIESQRKTLDIIKRLSTKPFTPLSDFVGRGIEIYKQKGSNVTLPLIWGASIASYPFFGKTAETEGRLIALQGDFAIKELQRRIAEQYGDRSGVERAAARVLQSQENWHALERDETAKRFVKGRTIVIDDVDLTTWLIEAAVLYAGKPISLQSLQSLPVLFPFVLIHPLTYLVSTSKNMMIQSAGPHQQYVTLK